jgi:hypothetical protein
MFETPGAANMTIETLARLAAAFKVGLLVKFVPFSEMLRSENEYSQDRFFVTPVDKDMEFLDPDSVWREQSSAGSAAGAAFAPFNTQQDLPLLSALDSFQQPSGRKGAAAA